MHAWHGYFSQPERMTSKMAEIPLTQELSAPATGSGIIADASDWLTFRRFSLLLLLLILVFFPDIIFGAKTFLFRDYAFFGYPLAHYHREAFWRGEVPLWNPLSNCGIPFLAQWNTMVFYPLSLIYLLLPMPWSLGWFCLLHIFLAGLGMYSLAYRWTGNRLGAGLAGIAFAFSGVTMSCLIWPSSIAALALTPWIWLCVERGWNRGGPDLLKAVFVGAAQMLTGAPEIILCTWAVVGAFWLVQWLGASQARWQMCSRLALMLFLVSALSALQLLPFFDLLRHSHRTVDPGDATKWSMPPWGWANLFVPLFRSSPSQMGVFLQESQAWLSSYYLGIGVLVFALAAIWQVRRPIVWVCGLALGLSLILALGEAGHLFSWIAKLVPQSGLMRYPIKLVIPAACVAPLLAAFAVTRWQTCGEQQKSDFRKAILVIGLGSLLLIIAIVCFSLKFPGEDEQPRTTLLNGFSRGAVLVLLLPVFLASCPKQTADLAKPAPVNHCTTSMRCVPWSVMLPPE